MLIINAALRDRNISSVTCYRILQKDWGKKKERSNEKKGIKSENLWRIFLTLSQKSKWIKIASLLHTNPQSDNLWRFLLGLKWELEIHIPGLVFNFLNAAGSINVYKHKFYTWQWYHYCVWFMWPSGTELWVTRQSQTKAHFKALSCLCCWSQSYVGQIFILLTATANQLSLFIFYFCSVNMKRT